MANIGQDKIDHIVFLWGRIDFNFYYYSQIWYHRENGCFPREEEEIEQDHKRNTKLIKDLRADVDEEMFSPMDVNVLKYVAQDLSHWNIKNPLEMNSGAFSEWLLIARHVKAEEKAGKYEIVRESDWEGLRAYYLKTKDLQLQSEEDPDADWEYLAKYYEEHTK